MGIEDSLVEVFYSLGALDRRMGKPKTNPPTVCNERSKAAWLAGWERADAEAAAREEAVLAA